MVAPSGSRVAVPSLRPGPAKAPHQHERRYAMGGTLDEFHAPLSLVWVSSRLDSVSSNGSSMGGEVSGDNATRGRAPSGASAEDGQGILSESLHGIRRNFVEQIAEEPSYPAPHAQNQLHAEMIQQEEELICAARAICECGRRGGGGGGLQIGGVGVVAPKLPTALLKLWERSFDAGTRSHFPDSEHGKASGRKRKLTVVRKRVDLNSRRCAGKGA